MIPRYFNASYLHFVNHYADTPAAKTLLLPIRTVFKHALHHCSVSAESVVKLLAAYSALATLPSVDPTNLFGQTILEELKGSFQSRSKMNRETVLCMLQVLRNIILYNTYV